MLRFIINFFDKLEDRIRHRLSKHPMVYALISGIGVVLFWRGVWNVADLMNISPVWSLILSLVILLLTGTFVSFFIGEQIILSGIKSEKRIDEKTEKEVKQEGLAIANLKSDLEEIKEEISSIRALIERSDL